MQYRSMEQIPREADIVTMPSLSRRDRLERWVEALARHPALRAIPEYGPRRERNGRRADHSPLTVAYDDPLLRAAGLRGWRLGHRTYAVGVAGTCQACGGSWPSAKPAVWRCRLAPPRHRPKLVHVLRLIYFLHAQADARC
jgi:hypothetical protein